MSYLATTEKATRLPFRGKQRCRIDFHAYEVEKRCHIGTGYVFGQLDWANAARREFSVVARIIDIAATEPVVSSNELLSLWTFDETLKTSVEIWECHEIGAQVA